MRARSTKPIARLVAAIILLLLCERVAHASTPIIYRSLEWTVAEARLIVRGRIVGRGDPPRAGDGDRYRLQVLEVIKGQPSTAELVVIDPGRMDRWDNPRWLAGETDVILFLDGTLEVSNWLAFGEPKTLDFVARDFRKLNDPQEILRVIHEYKHIGQHEPVRGITIFDGRRFLTVPCHEIMLMPAERWLNSPKHQLRYSAVRIFSHLRPPGFRDSVKPLLADLHSEIRDTSVWTFRDYPVRRAAAYLVYDTNDPILERLELFEPSFRPVQTRHYVMVLATPVTGAALAWIAGSCFNRTRRRRNKRQIRTRSFLAALIAIAAIGLFVSTYFRFQEWYHRGSGPGRMLGLVNGKVYVITFPDLTGAPIFLYDSYPGDGELQARWDPAAFAPKISPLLHGVNYESGSLEFEGTLHSYSAVALPLWPLVALAILPLWVIANGLLRRRARLRRGLCIHCGFDLRASPNLCPECGSNNLLLSKT